MPRSIAIGDIHGCLKTFKALLDRLQLSNTDTLYLLGDYIDRGPDSKRVIDLIWALQNKGYNIVTLRGNHEQMLIDDYDDGIAKNYKAARDARLLESFDVKYINDIPPQYIDFCRQLPFYKVVGDYILVHAGLDFGLKNPLDDKANIIWIRNWYAQINWNWLGKRMIIHGHTPQTRMETGAQKRNLAKNRVLNIDCGAFLGSYKRKGLGCLTAFDMTEDKIYFQENIETNNIY